MNITLYNNTSDPRAVTKALTGAATLSNCIMRDETEVVNPQFEIETASAPTAYNYLYCDYTGRYYFIREITMVRNGLFRLSCHVDVLMTYAAAIRGKNATIARNEYTKNGYIPDERYKSLAYEEIVTKQFPNEMNQDSIILLTVG